MPLKYALAEPTSVVKIEKHNIVISGGTKADEGSHIVQIVVTEPTTGA